MPLQLPQMKPSYKFTPPTRKTPSPKQPTLVSQLLSSTMASVKILSKAHVNPKKSIGRRECQLVTFDLPYIAFYYNQKLLIYKGGDSDFEERVEKFEEGLGVVLEEFYQLAGKLGKDEEGVFRVEYDDDMDGVEVAVAAAEEIGIADLIVEEGTEMLKELVPYNGVLNFEGLHRPLLAVQVIIMFEFLLHTLHAVEYMINAPTTCFL